MLDSQRIHEDWVHFFDTVHTDDGWITPLLSAVNGVPFEIARWKPAPQISSIWEIVVHATGWIEDLLADLTGSSTIDVTDWPLVDPETESSWLSTVARLQEQVTLLGRQVKGLTVEDLYEAPVRIRKRRSERLTNIFVHNAYHTGQIIKMRQLYAAQRELSTVA